MIPGGAARVGKRRCHGGVNGFTMVEVLIALIVGVVAFFPLLSMFQTGIKTSIHNANWGRARDLAKRYLDEVRSLPFADVKAGAPLTYKSLQAGGDVTFPATDTIDGVVYTTTLRVESITPIHFLFRRMNMMGGVIPPASEPPDSLEVQDQLKKLEVAVRFPGSGNDASGNRVQLEYTMTTHMADLLR